MDAHYIGDHALVNAAFRHSQHIDLLKVYPIERIAIQIRSEQVTSLAVEVSRDSENWTSVYSGPKEVSNEGTGSFLDLRLSSEICARFVKVSLPGDNNLTLAEATVFVRGDVLSFVQFRENFGVTGLALKVEEPNRPIFSLYSLETGDIPSSGVSIPIIGLKLDHSGRFGNLLNQYENLIIIAEKSGLKYIQLGTHELSNLPAPVTVGDLTFLPNRFPLPPGGAFLTGGFFDTAPFEPLLKPFYSGADEIERCRVTRKYIRSHLLTGLSIRKDHFEDELTIHIRAGDIFASDQPVIFGYRQPPLAFYTIVINRMLSSGTIMRVRLIYEDRANPCIEALECFLKDKNIPFRCSSGALADDLSALIDAPHLVFGFGTFGYAVCRLSRHIKTLHYFAPELGGRYGLIPGIDRVYSVYDRAGGYIKAFEIVNGTVCEGEWRNTPEQYELMRTYPPHALEIVDVKV